MKRTDPWWKNPDRNCATGDPRRFFPSRSDQRATLDATKHCLGCPVIEDCLRWTLSKEWGDSKSGREGIFAATTPAQRFHLEQRIRTRRAARAVA